MNYVIQLLLCLFLFFVQSSLSAQPSPGRMDSLEHVLRTATDAETRCKTLDGLFSECKIADPEKARKFADEQLALAEKIGSPAHRAMANLNISMVSPDSCRIYAERVLQLLAAYPNDVGVQKTAAPVHLAIGRDYYYKGQLDHALEHYREAEKHQPTTRVQAFILNNIGLVMEEQHKPDEALEAYKKVLEIGRQTNDKSVQVFAFANTGNVFRDMGDTQNAMDYYQKSIAIRKELGDNEGLLIDYYNIGLLLQETDSMMEKAVSQFEMILQKSTEQQNEMMITAALVNLGLMHLTLGNVEKSLDFANRTWERVKNFPDEDSDKWQTLALFGKIYNVKNDFRKGLDFSQKALAGIRKARQNDDEESRKMLFQIAVAQFGTGDMDGGRKTLYQCEEIGEQIGLEKMKTELATSEAKFKVKEHEFALQESQRANRLQVEKTAAQRNLYLGLLGAAGLFLLFGFVVFRRSQRDKALIVSQKALLEQSLAEKETLLKEIHHRVKNNLQIISGLLEKQARKTTDETAKKLMQEGQDRVFSMALVHQNLYQSDNLSAIEIKSYLEALTKNIEASQASPDQKIEVKLDVDDSTLDIDTAIPVALILNELITNSFKYAFSGRAAGLIHVDFHQKANEFFLKVRDNGIGLAADFDISKSKSLGLNLVRGLVRQLDGQFNFGSSADGAVFEIQFART